MSAKLYTCPFPIGGLLRFVDGRHPCALAYHALKGAGVAFEHIKVPMRRRLRNHVQELSGQRLVPILELEDGRVICDSKEIVRFAEGAAGD